MMYILRTMAELRVFFDTGFRRNGVEIMVTNQNIRTLNTCKTTIVQICNFLGKLRMSATLLHGYLELNHSEKRHEIVLNQLYILTARIVHFNSSNSRKRMRDKNKIIS